VLLDLLLSVCCKCLLALFLNDVLIDVGPRVGPGAVSKWVSV